MARPKRQRYVSFLPGVTYFKPRGIPLGELEEVNLSVDEFEAIRLADWKEIDQVKAAGKMKVSQSTFQRILTLAHKKIAQALVEGKAIKVKGGEIVMPFGFGRSPGRGGGRGRMGGPFSAGPGGVCICTNPECKNEISHQAGVPCYQTKCPKCGSPMIRKR
jgi:predicted DNA-binding protein (UPF0251 family)